MTKHKWNKLPDSVGARYKKWKCTVCGCVRMLGYHKFSKFLYVRNGRFSEDYLECIDMDVENAKTID